jgi:hypothetical protein
MTATTPVERVAELLEGVNYRRIAIPVTIGGIEFVFPALFVGTRLSQDLIVVVDSTVEKEERILQKIEGLARVLDRLRSRRPLTTIVVGRRPSNEIMDAMFRVSRVLPVGTASDTANLTDWLSVLLPLDLPDTKEGGIPVSQMDREDETDRDPIAKMLLNSARISEEATRELLHKLLAEPFKPAAAEPAETEIA